MDKYFELVQLAKEHQYLYHYTNLESLRCILKNKSLRLSRIDKVNDPLENERIKALWNKKVYLFCFTSNLDNSEHFFNMYGEIRLEFSMDEIKVDEVYSDPLLQNPFDSFSASDRLTQMTEKNYDKIAYWCVYDTSIADVYYTEDLNKHILPDGYESNAGLIKSKKGIDHCFNEQNWEREAETRIRVALRPKGPENVLDRKTCMFCCPVPPFEYIYMQLPRITGITLSPNLPEDDKNKVFMVIKKYGIL